MVEDGLELTRRRRRRRRRRFLVGTLLVLAVGLVAFQNFFFHGNFGVVKPGRVYRSAQPKEGLSKLVDDWKVASILNLRGGGASDSFYQNEVQVTSAKGVDFYDYPMSATRRPSRRDLLVLLDLFERCRYPLLIHCKSGADRTGMASGLYLMAQGGVSPTRALDAFSLYYGHVPLFGPNRLHEPFREYAEWLSGQGRTHSPARLRAWVEREYKAEDSLEPLPPLPTGPRTEWRLRLSREGATQLLRTMR